MNIHTLATSILM